MKRIVTILTAAILLVSGMNVSLSSHFCEGRLAAVKLSFSGQLADCGMDSDNNQATHSHKPGLNSDCCSNTVSNYKVESNYESSEFHLADVLSHLSPAIAQIDFYGDYYYPAEITYKYYLPPDDLFTDSVKLSDICTFRI